MVSLLLLTCINTHTRHDPHTREHVCMHVHAHAHTKFCLFGVQKKIYSLRKGLSNINYLKLEIKQYPQILESRSQKDRNNKRRNNNNNFKKHNFCHTSNSKIGVHYIEHWSIFFPQLLQRSPWHSFSMQPFNSHTDSLPLPSWRFHFNQSWLSSSPSFHQCWAQCLAWLRDNGAWDTCDVIYWPPGSQPSYDLLVPAGKKGVWSRDYKARNWPLVWGYKDKGFLLKKPTWQDW